jgi:hypothetical protein
VLKYYPIPKKYKFLLRSWLRVKIYGKKNWKLCITNFFYT